MEHERFGPERIALVPVIIAAVCALPLALTSARLLWVLLLPLAAGVWVLRARVVAGRDALEVCNGLGVATYRWDDVEGIDVPRRGPARLLLTGGRRVLLSAVPRQELRRFMATAPGRS